MRYGCPTRWVAASGLVLMMPIPQSLCPCIARLPRCPRATARARPTCTPWTGTAHSGSTTGLDILLSQFGTSPLFHVQFYLLLLYLHTDFSGDRSGTQRNIQVQSKLGQSSNGIFHRNRTNILNTCVETQRTLNSQRHREKKADWRHLPRRLHVT